MMSEALTIALADMLFVDTLVKSGVEYDYSKRCIYPLFKDCNLIINLEKMENLKKITIANYKYCLLGDDTYYKKLLDEAGSSYENLEKFKKKYRPFYVSDYKWTIFNYSNMTSNEQNIKKWFSQTSSIRDATSNIKLDIS